MKDKNIKRINIALFFVLLCFVAVLCYFVRPANDDFYYGTFLDNGISGFIDETINHYNTVMGRVFVHIVLCPLLLFNMLPFKVFNVLLVIGTAFVVSKIVSDKEDLPISDAVLFLSTFCLIGGYVLSDGALWGAGSLNYLFPVFLGLLYFYLFSKGIKKPNYALLLLAPFAAATTELGGILAIFSIVFCVLTDFKNSKKHKGYVCLNSVLALAGYVTFFISGGTKMRLSANEVAGVGLFDTMVANFSIFVRKILSPDGLSIVVLLAMIGILILAVKNKNKVMAGVCAVCSVLILLASMGVVFHLWQVAIVAVLSFLVLWAGVVLSKDKTLIFFMIALTISLGVCIVSPVIGDRMLFPCGLYLAVIFVRTIILCGLSDKAKLYVNAVITVFAIASLVFLIGKFSANAEIIDKNVKATVECSGEILEVQNVPDELFSGGTVPSTMNFGVYYLKHYGIENAEIVNQEDGVPLVRCGIQYVPVRQAKELGADIRWHLACAEVKMADTTYRFSKGADAADIGGGKSVKLKNPVRVINGTTYISKEDFDDIFE